MSRQYLAPGETPRLTAFVGASAVIHPHDWAGDRLDSTGPATPT